MSKAVAKILVILFVIFLIANSASAVKVADITRISGQRNNILTGMGLVYGLKGTGDGGDFLPAIKPLATMLEKFHNATPVADLQNVQNVAIVAITAVIPKNGVREGDAIDIVIMSNGAASSLKGGHLFLTPLLGPTGEGGIYALAQGPVIIEDPSTPTVGRIKGGAIMEVDLPQRYIEDGRFTLILEDPAASWTTASEIAQIINDAESTTGETLAVAVDPKNVIVTIPEPERSRPDSFISRVQLLPVTLLPSEARVQINERTGTMILSGDVEISPVVISHKGLTISTLNPPPVPTPRTPVTTNKDFVSIDTSNRGGAKLRDLVNALEQLKVPAEDRITIVKQLYDTGMLHAKLIVE